MNSMNEFPKVMRQAREDLLATVRGRFSPEDWEKILSLAAEKWHAHAGPGAHTEEQESAAWQAVILDFNRNSYWGFQPDYKPAKIEKRQNWGVQFMVLVFLTFTVGNMLLAWSGQIYTASDEPRDAYLFYAVLALVASAFIYFLWRTRGYKD